MNNERRKEGCLSRIPDGSFFVTMMIIHPWTYSLFRIPIVVIQSYLQSKMVEHKEYFAYTFALGGTTGRGTRIREIPCDVYHRHECRHRSLLKNEVLVVTNISIFVDKQTIVSYKQGYHSSQGYRRGLARRIA